MKSRHAILILLSLTLVCSGCATGTYKTRTDANQNSVSLATSGSSANRAAKFGLINLSPVETESDGVPIPKPQSLSGNRSTPKNTVLSVGYTENDSERSPHESKIDFSALEDTELASDGQEQSCRLEENETGDTESNDDFGRALSPPSALPFESDFTPTSWTGVTIDQVREMAYDHHPVIARAQAKLDALRGRHLQSGLPNNPRVGVNADDVNEEGRAGRWGVQFGRQVVRQDKRQANQAIICAEIEIATEKLKAAQRRLDTDITTRFYDCMVAQEQVAMARRMQDLANRATELSRRLYAAQEVARSAVLQSELELEKSNVAARRLENQHLWTKRQLAALLGKEELPTEFVGGSIGEVSLKHDFEASYDRLLKHSPEMSVLFADIERLRRVASRERLETLSDITWQTTVQYDTTEDNVIGGFQATWQIPTLNQNQGAIYEAERNIAVGQHTAEVKALDIRQRLAAQWQLYVDAQLQVDAFRDSILPKSQDALELLMKGYAAGEVELLEVLVAQRTFFQTQVAYLENVRSLSRQNARIQGMLLGDSLSR